MARSLKSQKSGRWSYEIDLTAVFAAGREPDRSDYSDLFRDTRTEIESLIRLFEASGAVDAAMDFGTVIDEIDCFLGPDSTLEDFDGVLEMLYDYADIYKVWVKK